MAIGELKLIVWVSLAFSLTLNGGSLVSGDGSEADEGSCICGLNKPILDQLERIVKESTKETCQRLPAAPSEASNYDHKNDASQEHKSQAENQLNNQNENKNDISLGNFSWPSRKPDAAILEANNQNEAAKNDNSEPKGGEEKPEKKPANGWDLIEKLTDEIHRLEGLISKPAATTSSSAGFTLTPFAIGGSESMQEQSNNPASGQLTNDKHPSTPIEQPINSGFLGGVEIDPNGDQKANQTQMKPDNLASVIQLTVPNVVSNIFSNIQNLTLATELGIPSKPSSEDNPAVLTSINGQTVNIQGDSSVQITAEGEKLFMAWIEQQIATLHLTASMAKYIQTSAMNLFRKIVKQYVERVEKMGGSIEVNVRKATQLALTNTQTLIRFLLKHYLYVSAGIMQLIGEQVSRIGKQLDQTGETIVHFSLNPFDIMSKVMESLPNPSDYSKYFRNLGKHLLGELTWSGSSALENNDNSESKQNQVSTEQQQQQPEGSDDNKQKINMNGLFKKTMGALSKTLSSWIG